MLAQSNAINNPNAFFRKPLRAETYAKAELVCEPLNLFDIAPLADGAAALLLTRSSLAPKDLPHPLVKVTGSTVAVDALSLHDRVNPLTFLAARQSLREACRQAGILPGDADFFELGGMHIPSMPHSLSKPADSPNRVRAHGWPRKVIFH